MQPADDVVAAAGGAAVQKDKDALARVLRERKQAADKAAEDKRKAEEDKRKPAADPAAAAASPAAESGEVSEGCHRVCC